MNPANRPRLAVDHRWEKSKQSGAVTLRGAKAKQYSCSDTCQDVKYRKEILIENVVECVPFWEFGRRFIEDCRDSEEEKGAGCRAEAQQLQMQDKQRGAKNLR